MVLSLTVNGQPISVSVEADTPLLWVLRDHLNLTGTKFGCGVASCGACTVHVDGQPVRSCQTLIEDVEGSTVTTIEGVHGEVAQAVQSAWRELDVVQCGYCQSGQIMSAIGLLTETPSPTHEETMTYMSGNVCRCATYPRIQQGIQLASSKLGD
ncbi:Isoquinoline 1-oxidoreductase subunit alpha [Pseudovibrio sp. Ad5]|uniref:(2Fe-2S)-binding protein n=1 Tax=Pseudovibrio sp. Ad5 TaxID=989436 RepID=UPI0007AEDE2C|nr:(2Fe-2S)-binding protein [Pseudovibrio sp. Ad5]KZK99421.1 Isoquinoline 1-oxidoreductase subunit alpha [Pseudovibrio sp. Ad5]